MSPRPTSEGSDGRSAPRARRDADGVRVVRTGGGIRARVWALVALAGLACVGLAWWSFAGSGGPSEPLPVAPSPPEPAASAPAPPPPVASAPPPEEPPPEERSEREPPPDDPGYTIDASGKTGIAAFPPPGTKPLQRGIVVPEGYELPEGYVRHYQVTDDGGRLPAILMFHPDYELVGEDGEGKPLPEDRIVPPELAPPGMPVEMLELPEGGVTGEGAP